MKIYNWIRKNWSDPVWSKVFAGIILSFLAGIGTLLYSAVKQISIADLYQKSVNSHIQINYFTIIIIAIVLISLLVPAFLLNVIRFQLKHLKRSKKVLPSVPAAAVDIQSIFPGKWLNEYKFQDGGGGKEVLEIKNGNEYYALGKHLFNIDDVLIDRKKKILQFRKVGVGDNRIAVNNLRIISDLKYEGIEPGGTKITYTRIE